LCPGEITAARVAPDEVVATVRRTDGSGEEVAARLLVAADGARSSVRDMLGITANHISYAQRAIVGNLLPEKSLHNCA
jgi:2-polyprenyl-6-methoxyphenol hydroxylase-like FAD-dependent oxidoreductase